MYNKNAVEHKSSERAKLNRDVEEFLKQGGKITQGRGLIDYDQVEINPDPLNRKRLQARRKYREYGKSIVEIARDLGVTTKTIRGWIDGCKKDDSR